MYQLVVRYLVGTVLLACLLSLLDFLPFKTTDIVQTAFLTLALTYVTNTLFAALFKVSTNKESLLITALILTLTIGPGTITELALPIAIASIAAVGSKFLLRWHNHHIFNPAAVGLLAATLLTSSGSSWWIGTPPLSWITIGGGLIICYKIRRVKAAVLFVLVYLGAFAILNLTALDLATSLSLIKTLLIGSPLVFLATIMMVEPATSPSSLRNKYVYAAFVALAIVGLQTYAPSIAVSFELALLAGNVLTRIIEPHNTFQMTLSERQSRAHSIESFFFEAVPPVKFTAGQFLEWTVPHAKPDSRGNRRWFTLASSPRSNRIELTTKFATKGSSFKTALQALKIGDRIWAHGLEGDFILPENKDRPLVFIAGGIGITPFHSMIQFLLDSGESRNITLIYAAKTAEELIYQEVFEEAKRAFGLKLLTVVSEGSPLPSGRVGAVDAVLLTQEVPEITSADVFVSGPEPMVETLSQTLRELGVANSAIHQDFFPGYLASDVEQINGR